MNFQDELKALKQRIAELENQAKEEQEFPQDDDNYWYIDETGEVLIESWDGLSSEIDMLEIGNIYKTEDEAEFAVEKLKVEAELRKFSTPYKILSRNWLITEAKDGTIEALWSFRSKSQGTLYFESKEKVQQAIKSVGEERIKKYIFGVED